MSKPSRKINNVVEFSSANKESIEKVVVKADLDNGYTRIANTLIEQEYSFEFNVLPLRLFKYVIRQTYGYQRKSAYITNAQIGIDTKGLIRADKASSVVRDLVSMNVISIGNASRFGRTIEINTTVSTWKTLPKISRKPPKQQTTVVDSVDTVARSNATVADSGTTAARHIYKEESIKEEINNSCTVGTEPSTKIDPIESQAKEIIDYLNTQANSKFQHSTASLKHLRARLREGMSFDDLKLIVDYKVWEWGGDPKWGQYIRPKTLFSENAESYINAANQVKESGINPNEVSRSDYSQSSNQKLSTVERNSQKGRELEAQLLEQIERRDSVSGYEIVDQDG